MGSIPTGDNFYFAFFHQCWQNSARIWQKIANYRKTRICSPDFTVSQIQCNFTIPSSEADSKNNKIYTCDLPSTLCVKQTKQSTRINIIAPCLRYDDLSVINMSLNIDTEWTTETPVSWISASLSWISISKSWISTSISGISTSTSWTSNFIFLKIQ